MGPLDLLIDDLKKNLAGKVLYMAIAKNDADQYNPQSCDCTEVIIVMDDRILIAEHEKDGETGAISFDTLSDFNGEMRRLRVTAPSDGTFEFMSVQYSDDGSLDGAKYRYGDCYVFIFADEYNLIVTKSREDLFFEDDDASGSEQEPPVLFD